MNEFSQSDSTLPVNKVKLLEALLKQKGVKVSNPQSIPRRSETGPCTLSFAQQRLWFLDQLEPDGSAYNIASAIRLRGKVSIAGLEHCLTEIVRRHEILRTSFTTEGGQPVQVVHPPLPLAIPVVDLDQLAPVERETEVVRLAIAEGQTPFKLTQLPLIRATLLRLSDEEYVLLLTMHHIISDGWSMGILVSELTELYRGYCIGKLVAFPELPIQYGDFAQWQQQWLQDQVLEQARTYWRQHLADAPPILELPTDYSRPPIQTSRGAQYALSIPAPLVTELRALGQQEGASLFMLLLAVFHTLLYRYTGQDDIVIGTPVANRTRAELEALIGCFVNTLILRTQCPGTARFRELLQRVREVVLGGLAHQDMPFEKLVEELHPERDLSHTPLFQVMFALQNAPLTITDLPDLTIQPIDIDHGTAQFDLSLAMVETEGTLAGWVEYNTDLFKTSTIERLVGHFQTLLQAIAANPDQHLDSLSLLTASEYQRLDDWNSTITDSRIVVSLSELIEAQVEQTPDAVAVICGTDQITYAELNKQANTIAHALYTLGVQPETRIAICLQRSLDLITSIVGVLKVGAAYVPIDPSYPLDRITALLTDANVSIVVTYTEFVSVLPDELHIINLDVDNPALSGTDTTNPSLGVSPDSIACVIYTSGSTGQPKGVLLEHSGIINLITSFNQSYQTTVHDRVLPLTSLASASFVGEIFPILCAGGTLILADQSQILDIDALIDLIASQSVTIVSTVPALMARLNAKKHELPRLRLILSGGEALSTADVDRLLDSTTIVNGYGITEASICSTTYHLDASTLPNIQQIPIGQPIINHQVYILDRMLNLMPIGCPGEVYLAGTGLSRGYLNNPALTAEKFIPNIYAPGTRMYRTGDRAKWLPDGNIMFLGRVDHQVKMRGFRIEVGEIEAILEQHPKIRDCVVCVREHGPDTKHLVCYVVAHQDQLLTSAELYNWLRDRVPLYMIPSAFVFLADLPLNANGKIDLKLLPAPDQIRPELEGMYVAPQTEAERTISAIWQEVLHLEHIGIHDNFFNLGGHSLLLAQVHVKLREKFKQELVLVDLFKYPSIHTLATFLTQSHVEPVSFDALHTRVNKRKEALRRQRQSVKQSERTLDHE